MIYGLDWWRHIADPVSFFYQSPTKNLHPIWQKTLTQSLSISYVQFVDNLT
jgi:hypothetical protein